MHHYHQIASILRIKILNFMYFCSSSLLLDTNESNSIEAKYEIFKAVSRLLVYKWFQNGINDWNESWIVDSVALYITEIAQKNVS